MPLIVNGHVVSEELIRLESDRLSQNPQWTQIADVNERSQRLRAAAEFSAVHHILVEQTAASDPRPVEADEIDREIARQKAAGGCRAVYNDAHLRKQVDLQLRVHRLQRELVANAAKPSEADIESFYEANRENFISPETFDAAHILLNVNEVQSEEQAQARVEAALAELEAGEDFTVVADRYSDCKGNGGELGKFPAGYMVEEFDRALRGIAPGERTGVFTTPFGFHIAKLHSIRSGGPAPEGRVLYLLSWHRVVANSTWLLTH